MGQLAVRTQLKEALRAAEAQGDSRQISTLRLILTAIQERDIALRAQDQCGGIGGDDIACILRAMVEERHQAASTYEASGRFDLVEQEHEEIQIIGRFLPAPLTDEEIQGACNQVMDEIGAKGLRDIGRCMCALKARYDGRMDFTKARFIVKRQLALPGNTAAPLA